MDLFFKVSAGVLLTVILCLVLAKQGKDFSVLLVIFVCCMVGIAAMNYLQQIIDFLNSLQAVGNLDSGMIKILLKTVGIGLLSEITCMICTDAGNGALGKTIQILAAAVILWLSIPIFTKLMELVEQILGAV